MPGMNSGLSDTNPVLVTAFRTALLHQGLIILALFAVLALAWVSAREWLPAARSAARAGGQAASFGRSAGYPGRAVEPPGRRLLRSSFGIIWIFDGLLQAQPAMAAGMPSQVMEPTAAASPDWVQHVVNWGGTTWSYHPIQAGAAAVWIQVGIGAWLIAASSGRPSRLAGLVSVGWGLVVWVFGESFGGIFAPGLTILFGAPGAVLFYCAAGALVALPDRCWRTPQLGRLILAGLGSFFVGMAVLQAWPGRGFWQGVLHGRPGTLTSMIQSMATTPQPRLLVAWLSSFGSFVGSHGFAVNLLAVIALAVIGVGLLSGQPRVIRPTLIFMIAFCLTDWVLIEDLGFLGGLGTDPNSMIPMALIGIGGYLAMIQVPAPTPASEPVGADEPEVTLATESALPSAAAADNPAARRPGGRDRHLPARLAQAFASASMRAVLALWAAAVVIIGVAPMAIAQASPNADPIIAEAIDGNITPLNATAAAFTLTDQYGRQVSLASLRGKVVLLTFLDPVCTTDCPLIAQEFREANQVLGTKSRDVELVAIVANPIYLGIAYTRAFDQQEQLTSVPNWLYLTGSLARLQQAWQNYAIADQILPAGGMIAHSDIAYVIGANGHIRAELDFDPGPGTATTVSSFAVELSDAAEQLLRSS